MGCWFEMITEKIIIFQHTIRYNTNLWSVKTNIFLFQWLLHKSLPSQARLMFFACISGKSVYSLNNGIVNNNNNNNSEERLNIEMPAPEQATELSELNLFPNVCVIV